MSTGITVLLTTHYMDEAEAVADRVGIMDRGRIVAEGTPGELIEQMGSDRIRIQGKGNADAFSRSVKLLPFVESLKAVRSMIQIGVDSGNRRLVPIVEQAVKTGYHIDEVSLSKPTLEDVFLHHTGRRLRDK